MKSYDNPYNIFPKEKYHVKLVHLHSGNSTEQQRGKSSYMSLLQVWDKDSRQLGPHLEITARCRPGDNPSRAKAREVLRLKAQAAKQALGWV